MKFPVLFYIWLAAIWSISGTAFAAAPRIPNFTGRFALNKAKPAKVIREVIISASGSDGFEGQWELVHQGYRCRPYSTGPVSSGLEEMIRCVRVDKSIPFPRAIFDRTLVGLRNKPIVFGSKQYQAPQLDLTSALASWWIFENVLFDGHSYERFVYTPAAAAGAGKPSIAFQNDQGSTRQLVIKSIFPNTNEPQILSMDEDDPIPSENGSIVNGAISVIDHYHVDLDFTRTK